MRPVASKPSCADKRAVERVRVRLGADRMAAAYVVVVWRIRKAVGWDGMMV